MTSVSKFQDLEKIRKLIAGRKPSRREFVQLAMAAGLTAAAAEQLSISAAYAEPKRGGSFRQGLSYGSTSDSLDPATWPNIFGTFIFGACLTEIDPSNTVIPNLVESFEPADKAAKWVFKLHKGLTFHNGKSLTADDVVATYNHHRGENSKSAIKSALAQVADIKADGAETVVFTLKQANADFPYITGDYHLPIYPAKAQGGIEWEKGMGAGPFILQSFNPGVKATGKRNPNYHRTDRPYFDEMELVHILDVAARMNALTTGSVHHVDRCDVKTLDLLKRNPDIAITNLTGFAHYLTLMSVKAAPFDNVDVRLAVKWAIDREEIVKKVALGYGTVGNDNPIAPSVKFATNPEPVHRYDPEKAKFHLKKAGLDTLKVDLSTSDAAFVGADDAAVLIKSQAAKAGIDINLVRESRDGYWDNVWLKKPFMMSYWGGRPTCDWMFTTAYQAGGSWNDTHWEHPRFNELLLQARGETDEAKRAAMYAEMQQIVHDDGGAIVLMFTNYVCAHSKALAHGDLHSNWDNDGGWLSERWWFA